MVVITKPITAKESFHLYRKAEKTLYEWQAGKSYQATFHEGNKIIEVQSESGTCVFNGIQTDDVYLFFDWEDEHERPAAS